MIKSVLEPTKSTRYVYFDDNGIITCIAGRESEEYGTLHAIFEIDDIVEFLEGTAKFSDYTVKRSSEPLVFEIIKRNVNIKQRSTENQIIKILESDNSEINIEVYTDKLVFYASDDLVQRSNVSKEQEVKVSGYTEHPFFITYKDKPEFLLSVELIDFSRLLSGEKITINYEHKYDVSVYTRRYFDSYSLRRV